MTDNYQDNLKVQQDYYNNTADKYDGWHVDVPSALVVNQWNLDNLKKFLGEQKITKCLDLGCGSGRLSADLLKLSAEVYGLDASEALLAIATKKYPELKLTLGEVTKLPYEDNFFDLVVVNGAFHHFFALKETCIEIERVLKPAGVLAVLGEPNKNYNPRNIFWYGFIAYMVWRKILSLVSRRHSTEVIEPDAEAFEPLKMKKVLSDSGLQVEKFYTYDYGPRLNNNFWLKHYHRILKLEHKTLAKWAPLKGSAIQTFCRKKQA